MIYVILYYYMWFYPILYYFIWISFYLSFISLITLLGFCWSNPKVEYTFIKAFFISTTSWISFLFIFYLSVIRHSILFSLFIVLSLTSVLLPFHYFIDVSFTVSGAQRINWPFNTFKSQFSILYMISLSFLMSMPSVTSK